MGGREGYETLLNTDMKFELDNIAKFMRMAVDYGRSIGFEGDFYIEPKPKEPTKHQYDYDAATTIGFLRQYGLDKDFKLNIEANHATLAGHTFQHDLRVSAINGKAVEIIEDGRIDHFFKKRYSSYNQGIGKKIIEGKTNLAELAAYAEKLGAPELPGSGCQEYLESVMNNILFG